MTKVIKRGKHSRKPYLGFDDAGHFEWKHDRLDAIRYDSNIQAHEGGQIFLNSGAEIVKVDFFDGHYETYRDYEVQIFRETTGTHAWHFRVGRLMYGPTYKNSPLSIDYVSYAVAMTAARLMVDGMPRFDFW